MHTKCITSLKTEVSNYIITWQYMTDASTKEKYLLTVKYLWNSKWYFHENPNDYFYETFIQTNWSHHRMHVSLVWKNDDNNNKDSEWMKKWE